MTTDILSAIDGALQDYGTSPDAMRWNPRLGEAREAAIPGLAPLAGREITIDFTGFAAEMRQLAEAMRRGAASIGCTVGPGRAFRGLSPSLVLFDEHFHHRDLVRCRDCNPRGNPGKLAVDGHEYRRRMKARARRNRR